MLSQLLTGKATHKSQRGSSPLRQRTKRGLQFPEPTNLAEYRPFAVPSVAHLSPFASVAAFTLGARKTEWYKGTRFGSSLCGQAALSKPRQISSNTLLETGEVSIYFETSLFAHPTFSSSHPLRSVFPSFPSLHRRLCGRGPTSRSVRAMWVYYVLDHFCMLLKLRSPFAPAQHHSHLSPVSVDASQAPEAASQVGAASPYRCSQSPQAPHLAPQISSERCVHCGLWPLWDFRSRAWQLILRC